MKFVEKTLTDALAEAAPGCVTVVISHPREKSSAFKNLVQKSNPLFTKEHHYLRSHFGMLADQQPFLALEWNQSGNNGLERRWLVQKVVDRIESISSSRHWQVVLDDYCDGEQLVIAEDLYRSTCDRLDGRSKLEEFSVAALDWNKIDPNRDVRFRHQLGYRDWVNANPDEMTSLEMEKRLKEFAGSNQCDCKVLDVQELQKLGLNLLLAVGQASDRSPSRLIMLTKNWKKNAADSLMLVGKGITFDTGGINVKAHEQLVNTMKNDMGGAALMAHLFMGLVESGYSKPLALVIPACENLVDGRSMKPGSVVTSYSGKRVMIEHTDAEGRLILADALSYGCEQLQPAKTFVAATLTTAALRQFTNFFAPVHFADSALQVALNEVAEKVGEGFTFWNAFLPFRDSNLSKIGEFTNMGRMPKDSSMGGGSNVAAHFLKEFCPAPMVHFDIFAVVWNWSGDYPGANFGATGAPFNSLFELIQSGRAI